jgi:dihydroorotate dehydrogenase electron transfer subunit
MSPVLQQCEVTYRERIRDDLVLLRCYAPGISQAANPGQFVHVRVGSGNLTILRRPYSLFDAEGETVDILVAVVGKGSAIIAASQVGEKLDMMGPLGNGFPHDPPDIPVWMIAGGVGLAPLNFLWRRWQPRGLDGEFLLGAATKGDLPLPKKSPLWNDCILSTDDGSLGFHGTVVSLLEHRIAMKLGGKDSGELVYVCGPVSMIRALAPVLIRHNLQGLVSIEQTMGCGIGACQGCAVAKSASESSEYVLTCLDGPVFKLDDIDIEHLPEHSHRA